MTTPPRKGHVKRIYPDPTDPGGIWYDVLRFDKLPLDVKGVGTGARYTVVNQPQWLDKDKENNNPARKMVQVDLKNPLDTDQTQKAWAINQMAWSGRGDGDGDSHQTVKWNFDNNSPDDQVNNPSDPVNTRRTGKAVRVHSNDLDDLLDMSQIQTWDDYLNALNKGTQDTGTYIDFEICKKFTVDNRPGDLYQTQTYALANDPVIKLFDATPDSVSPKDISRLDPLQIVVNIQWNTPACVIVTKANQVYYASKPDTWVEFDLPYNRSNNLDGFGHVRGVILDTTSKTYFLSFLLNNPTGIDPDRTDLYSAKAGFPNSKKHPPTSDWTLSHTFNEDYVAPDAAYYITTDLIVVFGGISFGSHSVDGPWSTDDGHVWNSTEITSHSPLLKGLQFPAPLWEKIDDSTSPATKTQYYLQQQLNSGALDAGNTYNLCNAAGTVLRTVSGPSGSRCFGMTAGNNKLLGIFILNPDVLDEGTDDPQNWVIGVSSNSTSWVTTPVIGNINGFTPSPGTNYPLPAVFGSTANAPSWSSFQEGLIDFVPGWDLFVFAGNRVDTANYTIWVSSDATTSVPINKTVPYLYTQPLQIYTSPDGVTWTRKFQATYTNGTLVPDQFDNPSPYRTTTYIRGDPAPGATTTPGADPVGITLGEFLLSLEPGVSYDDFPLTTSFSPEAVALPDPLAVTNDPQLLANDPGTYSATAGAAAARATTDFDAANPGWSVAIGGLPGSATFITPVGFYGPLYERDGTHPDQPSQTMTYPIVVLTDTYNYRNQVHAGFFDDMTPKAIASAGRTYPKNTS